MHNKNGYKDNKRIQLDKNTNRLSYKVGLLIKMVLVCLSFVARLKLTEAVKSRDNS